MVEVDSGAGMSGYKWIQGQVDRGRGGFRGR